MRTARARSCSVFKHLEIVERVYVEDGGRHLNVCDDAMKSSALVDVSSVTTRPVVVSEFFWPLRQQDVCAAVARTSQHDAPCVGQVAPGVNDTLNRIRRQQRQVGVHNQQSRGRVGSCNPRGAGDS
ncbi:hypothetical protein LMG27174_06275 [Paraburkholderia rhynchosiae]|uniref:Uncharacterized protein n=1 Tax=Paraburkholderia rhynchosiae TaxID=487049 RepID=A0A6J5CK24_9BURK|nr:hypothetical protein LMG27174_06275 [Paraburkholderia rhynchosiae]